MGHWDTLLIHIILPKVDKGSRREWEQDRTTIEEFPTLNEFIEFLTNRCAFLESVNHVNRNSQGQAQSDNRISRQTQRKNYAHSYVTSNTSSCSICSEAHKTHECNVLRDMSITDRSSEIKRKRLCFKCLKNYHGRRCNAPNCKQCKGHHHTLLPEPSDIKNANVKGMKNEHNSATNNKTQPQPVTSSKSSLQTTTVNHCSAQINTQVLLSIASVLVRDGTGNLHVCRALLDSGSQSNFITRDCAAKLNLTPRAIVTNIGGIGESVVNSSQQACAVIQSRLNKFQVKLAFIIINKITENLSTTDLDQKTLRIPLNIQLADPEYHISAGIDMLLGASVFWNLLCNR